MEYDDRSVKGMSSSLMRARIGTKLLSGLYESVPTLMTSAIRLSVELPINVGTSITCESAEIIVSSMTASSL